MKIKFKIKKCELIIEIKWNANKLFRLISMKRILKKVLKKFRKIIKNKIVKKEITCESKVHSFAKNELIDNSVGVVDETFVVDECVDCCYLTKKKESRMLMRLMSSNGRCEENDC